MPGADRHRHHDPPGVVRRLAAAAALGVFAMGAAVPAFAASGSIHLPTREDAIAAAAAVETLLNPKTPVETKLPGPATDDEHITVGLDLAGAPDRVHVVQNLHLTGLGDFRFKVPGPAIDVTGLPGSDEQPGLRKGAVLWQGFSPGTRVLSAVLDLHPELEAGRLPLAFHLRMTVGGRPLLQGRRASGPFSLTLRIANQSAVPVTISAAQTDAAQVGAALDATRRALLRRERPAPGSGGLPKALPATGPAASRSEQIEAPFRAGGMIRFASGSLSSISVEDGIERGGAVSFARELGGGAPLSTTIRVTGVAHRLSLPQIVVHAQPALPLAASIAPPTGRTWAAYAAAHPRASQHMVSLLLETLWRTARLASFDAYLGNPDPFGPAHSAYTFRLAPLPAHEAPVSAALPPHLHPFGIVVLVLIGLVVLFGGAVAWSRA